MSWMLGRKQVEVLVGTNSIVMNTNQSQLIWSVVVNKLLGEPINTGVYI